jgi:hypothetical protein
LGYRSDVGFVVEFEKEQNAEEFLKSIIWDLPKHDCQWAEQHFYKSGVYVVFDCDSIKWYDDFKDIQYLESVYKTSNNADGCVGWIFYRIGEEMEDIEFDHSGGSSQPPYDALMVCRSLSFNV